MNGSAIPKMLISTPAHRWSHPLAIGRELSVSAVYRDPMA
jgi:hypothetical protein